jgi:hypothetical protein
MFSVKRVAQLFISSARGAKWAPRNRTALGLVLIGLVASAIVYMLPSSEPVSGSAPATASAPTLSQGAVRPAIPMPPAAAALVQADEPVPTPAVSMPQTGEGSAGRKTVKPRAWHKWRLVRRAAHAWSFHARTAVLSEPCRYHCDDWAEPMTWHGGGY